MSAFTGRLALLVWTGCGLAVGIAPAIVVVALHLADPPARLQPDLPTWDHLGRDPQESPRGVTLRTVEGVALLPTLKDLRADPRLWLQPAEARFTNPRRLVFTDLVAVTTAMTVAVGGDTEELMREDVWEEAGLCEELKAIGRSCSYSDDSVECAELRSVHWRPCKYDVRRAIRVAVPEVRWGPERTLYVPEWVPSVVPTAARWDGYWWKLRL